jgi:hypothetical protein
MIADRATTFLARCAFVLAGLLAPGAQAATITINNLSQAGVGFNEPMPAAPVGGNPGTTLGEQRLNAFRHAAAIWAARLDSKVEIIIDADMLPLPCNANSAVLGQSLAEGLVRNVPGAAKADTWYPVALANKLIGRDYTPGDIGHDIYALFNSELGGPGCLVGSPFYLGLDGQHGTAIDLVEVLMHEFGHGLGFSVNPTNTLSGARADDSPSIWEHFMVDSTTNKRWLDMTDAERQASAVNPRHVAWSGANVLADAPKVLKAGIPQLTIAGSAAGSAAGVYLVGGASFGPPLSTIPSVVGQVMPIAAQAGGTGPGCEPFTAANALAVKGNVALIDRGVCNFSVKVQNAQDAGAIAVLIAENVPSDPPLDLGGTSATVQIPSLRIGQAAGIALKMQLQRRSRTSSGVLATLSFNTSVLAGVDVLGRPLLYTPNPFVAGSSVSHWDTVAFPNLLMEPNINVDLVQFVSAPHDLTLELLRDIGW